MRPRTKAPRAPVETIHPLQPRLETTHPSRTVSSAADRQPTASAKAPPRSASDRSSAAFSSSSRNGFERNPPTPSSYISRTVEIAGRAHADKTRRAYIAFRKGPHHLHPGHYGHPHIAHDRIHRRPRDCLQSLRAIACGPHLRAAAAPQPLRKHLPQLGLVIHDHHLRFGQLHTASPVSSGGAAASGSRRRKRVGLRPGRSSRGSTMVVRHGAREAQPNAHPRPASLGREESLHQPLQHLLVDPRPAVHHVELQPFAFDSASSLIHRSAHSCCVSASNELFIRLVMICPTCVSRQSSGGIPGCSSSRSSTSCRSKRASCICTTSSTMS